MEILLAHVQSQQVSKQLAGRKTGAVMEMTEPSR